MSEKIIDLKTLYSTELKPKLLELDQERKNILILIKQYVLFSIIPLLFGGGLVYYFHSPIPIIIIKSSQFGIFQALKR